MTGDKKYPACLLVRIEHPSGSDAPRLNVELGERREDTRDARGEFPYTPDTVKGLECEHGSLGLYSWVFDAKVSLGSGPEYQRLAYVDAYKLTGYAKTLATLNRRLAKYRDARGSSQSWTDQVLRFAEATGAKWIALPKAALDHVDAHSGRTGWRAREAWTFFSPADALFHLRGLESSFGPKVAHEPSVAVALDVLESAAAS